MKLEEAKQIQEAFNHFVKGGRLWYYSESDQKWYIQDTLWVEPTVCIKASNIIEDQFFESRKAHALGQEIEVKHLGAKQFKKDPMPFWCSLNEYRPKPKEPVYEWQWSVVYDGTEFVLSEHFTDEEAKELNYLVDKYEPSKRIRT